MQLQIPIFYTPDQAGVVFDNATTSGYEAALSTYSWSHRVGTGITNRALIVGVSIFATGSVTGVTYNGVAMTFVRSDTNGIYRSEIWQLVAPATGSNTVAVTLNASLTSIANAQSYANVDQTTPIDANNGANGTNTPAAGSVTPVTAKTRVVANLAAASASGVTSATGQAPRTNNSGAIGTGASDDKGIIDVAASTTLTWNGLGVTDSWGVSLVALRPVSLVAQLYSGLLLLMGIGG